MNRNLITKYFEENFFVIPIQKDGKIPLYKKWTENPISYNEVKQYVKHGYNIGVVSGKQSRKENYDLIMLDFDSRPEPFNAEWFRDLGTWIQFSPNGGFHILLRTHKDNSKEFLLSRLNGYCTTHGLGLAHRSTLNPKHEDNTLLDKDGVILSKKEHDTYFADTVRWTSMYFLVSPSKINGKVYWWLDDCKGEIKQI